MTKRRAESGKGVVRSDTGDKIHVFFDAVGEKTLALGIVAERALLAPIPSRPGRGAKPAARTRHPKAARRVR